MTIYICVCVCVLFHQDNKFISVLLRALIRIKDSKIIFYRTLSDPLEKFHFPTGSDEVLLKIILESSIHISNGYYLVCEFIYIELSTRNIQMLEI